MSTPAQEVSERVDVSVYAKPGQILLQVQRSGNEVVLHLDAQRLVEVLDTLHRAAARAGLEWPQGRGETML